MIDRLAKVRLLLSQAAYFDRQGNPAAAKASREAAERLGWPMFWHHPDVGVDTSPAYWEQRARWRKTEMVSESFILDRDGRVLFHARRHPTPVILPCV